MPNQPKTAVCAGRCGELKKIVAKGKCAACYKADRRAQGLDQETPKAPTAHRRDNASYEQRMREAGYARRMVDGRRQWVKKL